MVKNVDIPLIRILDYINKNLLGLLVKYLVFLMLV